MANILYPPILAKSAPAFSVDSANIYPITFSLPTILGLDSIGHIQIKVTRRNGESIVNTNVYPDGIIYKNKSVISETKSGTYLVSIVANPDLAQGKGWTAGQLYKIQLRFGTTPYLRKDETSEEDEPFYEWKENQIKQGNFSEWSTVMIVKGITSPSVTIVNNNGDGYENTTTPLFTGMCAMPEENAEIIDKTKFDLYDAEKKLIESSGWRTYTLTSNGAYDSYRFKTVLVNEADYSVIYSIHTINNYEKSSAEYNFAVLQTLLDKPGHISMTIDSDSVENVENGYISIRLTAKTESGLEPLTGSYVITRASEKDNFSYWEDIKYLYFSNTLMDNKEIYRDYTIESGVRYKYAIQRENKALIRTAQIREANETLEHRVFYEYAFLNCGDLQAKLKYDTKISSFKKSVLANKQDTVGSKFPTIMRNGAAYYAEFPISGTISFNSDIDNNSFFVKRNDGYYYKDELVFSIAGESDRKGSAVTRESILDRPRKEQVYFEKLFREKLEEFLNDGGYKLYRSSTEGNFIVTLMNVALQPKENLGRMIYGFTATAYEVAEFSLENLNKYNIIDIGTNLDAEEVVTGTEILFGQVSGIYTGRLDIETGNSISNSTNIIPEIRLAAEQKVGSEGYSYKLSKLKSIWIEPYPKIKLEEQKNVLRAKIADPEITNTEKNKYEEELKYTEKLEAALSTTPDNPVIFMDVQHRMVALGKNKVYSLQDESGEITDLTPLYTAPLLINFTYEAMLAADEKIVIKALVDKKNWNQLSGVFTDTHKILNSYNYLYSSSPEYRLAVTDGFKQPAYNVYKTLDILEVIKQQLRHDIELEMGVTFNEPEDKPGTYVDSLGRKYEFTGLAFVEIEANEGTALLVNGRKTFIGPTCKYVLNSSLELIETLAFEEPVFATINYAATAQIRSGGA